MPHKMFLLVLKLATALSALLICCKRGDLRADDVRLSARQLLSRSVSEHLRLSGDNASIELQRGELFEDDGPAAGYSYRPNEERLGEEVLLKKELIIPRQNPRQATLLVAPGGQLEVRINGKPAALEPLGKQGNYWRAYRFSPSLLIDGKNSIVFQGTGKLWIARDDEYAAGSLTRRKPPNRSAKSTDGGRTWNDRKLGTGGNIDGEYYVRLFLDQFCSRGQLTSEVFDLGNLEDKPVAPPVADVGPVRVDVDAVVAEGCSIHVSARTGTTFVPDETHWSGWSAIGPPGGIDEPRGRFLQVQLLLETEDPSRTPRVKTLSIAASPSRPEDWSAALRVREFHNERIVRSSIPFRHEPYDQPELARLRKAFQLDDVVEGATTEFELIKRLAVWSATRWQRGHLGDIYPAWNALEILKPHEDGTPIGGFCQQYNIVFLQACQSFGLAGRLISIGPGNMIDAIRGGHETVEIWSNQFGKWIYIDGNTAWYAVDPETNVPLSLWELRQRQVAAFRGERDRPIEVVTLADTKYQWKDLTHWPPLIELRLIPRSNFLEQPSPVPLNQGMRGWFWTGHYVWTDDLIPARMIYSNRVTQRENFEWTLNQAQLAVEATDMPGQLRVHVDTHTPGFAAFDVTVDGKPAVYTETPFAWKLHTGKNTLRVIPRNTAGRRGIASWITVEQP